MVIVTPLASNVPLIERAYLNYLVLDLSRVSLFECADYLAQLMTILGSILIMKVGRPAVIAVHVSLLKRSLLLV